MRKIIVMITIIIALVLTGCGNGNIASKGNEASTNNSAAKSSDSSASNQTTGGTAIIAKSQNIMSSSDKEELLNQVNKELDSLFENINKMDDAQDADLDLNQK